MARRAAVRSGRLEVHEHAYVSGRRVPATISHSHEGGNEPHQHANTGPAVYVIDKDDWNRMTSLVGGGRKTFTSSPTGEQSPIVELEDWQRGFEIILDEESCRRFADQHPGMVVTGAGVAPAARMVLAFKQEVRDPSGAWQPRLVKP